MNLELTFHTPTFYLGCEDQAQGCAEYLANTNPNMCTDSTGFRNGCQKSCGECGK